MNKIQLMNVGKKIFLQGKYINPANRDQIMQLGETLHDYQSAIAFPEKLICQDPLLDFRTPGLSNFTAMHLSRLWHLRGTGNTARKLLEIFIVGCPNRSAVSGESVLESYVSKYVFIALCNP